MIFELVALLCTGCFAGAAVYVTLVEHPARMECGLPVALAEFRPSYRRAAVMQAALAAVGALAAIAAWATGRSALALIAGLLLGAVIPYTLLVVFPTNKRLLDPSLDASAPDAGSAEFASRGVPFAVPLSDNDDGLRGFVIRDPDGYGLYFGRVKA